MSPATLSLGAPRVGGALRCAVASRSDKTSRRLRCAGIDADKRIISARPAMRCLPATKGLGAGAAPLRSANRRRRKPRAATRAVSGEGSSEEVCAPETLERLWSNVVPSSGSGTGQTGRLLRSPGSLPGAIALVAGTTVGAGMLALPSVCQRSGFVPSTCTLTVCWLYMVATGLLLLEVNLDTMCESGGGGVSLISMTERTLGKNGTRLAWCAYVFLHYALLVAYVSRVGEIVGEATHLDQSICSVAFAAGLGGFVYAAPDKTLENVNNALVAAVIGTFVPLLLIASRGVDVANLTSFSDWSEVPGTVAVIALAFVYHNVIPVVATQLEGDRNKSRAALFVGTAIPFAMFTLWDGAVLGGVSAEDLAAGINLDPLSTLQGTSPAAAGLVKSFSVFAVSTSFLGFVLGLVDFLSDGFGWREEGDARPYAATLIPPTIFAVSNPDIFLSALDTAGAFGVMTLFGCLPPAMAWANRHGEGLEDACEARREEMCGVLDPLVPGGRVGLGLLFGAAAAVVASEAVEKVGDAVQVAGSIGAA